MRPAFEGRIYPGGPAEWPDGWEQDEYFCPAALKLLRRGNPGGFSLVVHRDYLCYEYPLKLDVLSFSKLRLRLPVTVIGLPVSVGRPGYKGSFEALVADYKRRKGLFVVLNMETPPGKAAGVPFGQTLGTCVLQRHFNSLEAYLAALRSGYRRRLRRALQRGRGLAWRRVQGRDFSPEMYGLYRQVLARSDFPLETLDISFFQNAPGEIQVLWEGERPVAFVLLRRQGDSLSFVFGGMEYGLRERYDLYYNMLLKIIQEGIAAGCKSIDFGQTAERSKMRVGCGIVPRYLAVFCRGRLGNALLGRLVGLFCYRPPKEVCHPFGGQAETARAGGCSG